MIIILAVVAFAVLPVGEFLEFDKGEGTAVRVEIPQGASADKVADILLEKGVIERFIGTLDPECLAIHRNDIHSIEDLEYYVQKCLNNYNFSRPHMSLKCPKHKYILYTPAEFCATMGITIHLKKASTM